MPIGLGQAGQGLHGAQTSERIVVVACAERLQALQCEPQTSSQMSPTIFFTSSHFHPVI